MLPLAGFIDIAAEHARLGKELDKTAKDMAAISGRLNNPGFVAKAPEEVIEEARERQIALLARKAKIEEALARLSQVKLSRSAIDAHAAISLRRDTSLTEIMLPRHCGRRRPELADEPAGILPGHSDERGEIALGQLDLEAHTVAARLARRGWRVMQEFLIDPTTRLEGLRAEIGPGSCDMPRSGCAPSSDNRPDALSSSRHRMRLSGKCSTTVR